MVPIADNVTTQATTLATIPTSTTVATDEISGVHFQKFKLFDATADSTNAMKVSTVGSAAVDPRPPMVRLSSTPSTSTTPAYTAKDAIGSLLTFSNAARTSGGSVAVEAVQIVDKGQQMSAIDLILFDRSITAPTDNAIFNPSDTEATYCVGGFQILGSDYADFSTNSIAALTDLELVCTLNGTDLFGVLVARGTPTYTSTTDIVVTLTVQQL